MVDCVIWAQQVENIVIYTYICNYDMKNLTDSAYQVTFYNIEISVKLK